MKILYIWPGLTGYMGDCWRELGKHAQVKVLVDGVGLGGGFTDEVMAGLDWERVSETDVLEKIAAFSPDVIVVVGWHRAIPRRVAFAKELESVPKVLVMDMPWRRSVRCFAARFALRRYIRRFRGAFVHGAPSARYARWLGFRPDQIHRHCICGVNVRKFGGLEVSKFGSLDETSKPLNLQASSFLFVGRQAKEKGIETLKKAYEIYRRNGGAWTLTLPDWIDPKDVPRMMREHACLVLPSLWEPWGVVVAEAKAAGMKIIVSDRVGARLDIPCDEVVKAGDAKELAAAMKRVEVSKFGGLEDSKFGGLEVSKFGGLEGLDCEAWAMRVLGICKELT